jgi:uncharacterized protein YbjT (DUF2867 family)
LARVLIVGCGCRGRALAAELVAGGHVVRATTRRSEALAEISAVGAEAVIADPARLATVLPCIEGVSVVCWLAPAGRVEALLERLVDSPVRGFMCDADAAAPARAASERWRIPVEIVQEDPSDHAAWLAAAKRAVGRVLGGGSTEKAP